MCWNAATQSAWLCALSPTYVGPGTLNSQPGRKTRVVKPCAAQALTMPVSTLSYWPEAKAWYCWSGLSEPPAMEYIGRAMTGVSPLASGDCALDQACQLEFATQELAGF